MKKAQTSLEFLFVLGAFIFIAVVVVIAIGNFTQSAKGASNTQVRDIVEEIALHDLTVNSGGAYSGTVGTPISLNASASGGTQPYYFDWFFQGSTCTLSNQNRAVGTADFTCNSTGSFSVGISVLDAKSKSTAGIAQVNVS